MFSTIIYKTIGEHCSKPLYFVSCEKGMNLLIFNKFPHGFVIFVMVGKENFRKVVRSCGLHNEDCTDDSQPPI